MQKSLPFSIVTCCLLTVSAHAAKLTFEPVTNRHAKSAAATEDSAAAKPFVFKDASGKSVSVDVADSSAQRKLTKPVPTAKVDSSLNPSMVRAATIAQERANAHSKSRCWRYVKQALLAAGAVDSYPKTALAKQAGAELVHDYGFKKLPVTNPYAAPVGAVLVYTASGAPGHVEIRTKTGFASDFRTNKPSRRKLIGVYAKA